LKISGLDNSVLLLDKPAGITSFDFISQIRRIARIKKIGHSGTLDKFASGLLVICTGQATRLTRYFLESNKRYTGTIKLGIATDTCDITGEIVSQSELSGLDESTIRTVMAGFLGESVQVPPEYSSLKVRGERASDRVRRGETVTLEGRKIRITRADIIAVDIDKGTVDFDIACSKGTYIRSIARDFGKVLGTGACLQELRRIESGRFSIDKAASREDVEMYVAGKGPDFFAVDPADALCDFGRLILDDAGAAKVLNGAFFRREEVLSRDNRVGNIFVIFNGHEDLIAIADLDIDSWHISYHSVFNKQESY